MRVSSAEVIPYALPFREPYVSARGSLDRREMVLLRLRCEEGLIGLGEAVPLSLRGGSSLAQVVKELQQLSELDSIEEATLRGTMSTPARCAALTALMDLRGKRVALGSPSPSPSPPPASRPVRCNATLSAGAPGDVAEDALQWAADGFSAFKLKLGIGNDVAAVRAVREALGPSPRIRVDANASWDVETAKRTLAELEPLDVELVEQPVKTISETLALASCTSIPIAADESVASRADAEDAVATGAFALAGLKLSKVGGPEAAIEIAAVLPCFLSSALDGPIGIAAAAAVAQTLQEGTAEQDTDIAHGLATQRLFSSTIASMECELRGGMLHLPEGPGLGVEIEEAALQAHRL